jgi:prefoldin subunit 5
MSESIETLKKRLEFLKNERQIKYNELQELEKSKKRAGTSGILHALAGDAQTSILEIRQTKTRIEDVCGQIRRLDFEISTLETEIKKKEGDSAQRLCWSCQKNLSQFPTDAVHCPYCGSKL